MRTITRFIGPLVIVALLAGCASVGEVALKSYIHSKAEEAKARRQAKYIAEEMRAKNTGPEIGRLIEEHVIGNHTVKVNDATYQGRHGYFFSAFDISGQPRGNVFYFKDDEKDMKAMEAFSRMSSIEKKRYIHEDFLKGANVDLGPILEPDSPK